MGLDPSNETMLSPGARQIQASILHGAKDLRIETRSIQPPAVDELQVKVCSTGLCGSDLHYYNHGRNGDIIIKEPISLGHESAGVVVAIGSDVSGFQVGDKVALEVGIPCGECQRCSEGRYNICKEMRFRSSAKSFPHFQGTLQDSINHPAAKCHKLPNIIPLELGALVEPLSVAIHATRRARLLEGENVIVFGAGTVGLLTAAMAKMHGALLVVIADIDGARVAFAIENGFAHAGYEVPLTRGNGIDKELAIARAIAKDLGEVLETNGAASREADAVFDCTGVPSCVQTAIYAARPGGRVLLVGMGNPVYTLPVSAAALREVDLLGVFRYADTYPEGIELISRLDGKTPDFSKLITHRYRGLEEVEQAFDTAGRTKDMAGKLVLKVILDMEDR